MKVTLEMELDGLVRERLKGNNQEPTEKELKEEVTQMLFEVCEDWVLRGQEPDLEFEEEN